MENKWIDWPSMDRLIYSCIFDTSDPLYWAFVVHPGELKLASLFGNVGRISLDFPISKMNMRIWKYRRKYYGRKEGLWRSEVGLKNVTDLEHHEHRGFPMIVKSQI